MIDYEVPCVRFKIVMMIMISSLFLVNTPKTYIIDLLVGVPTNIFEQESCTVSFKAALTFWKIEIAQAILCGDDVFL